jgi:hypothetical protein
MSQYCCQDRIRAAQPSIDCFAFAVSADNLGCSRLPHSSFGISHDTWAHSKLGCDKCPILLEGGRYPDLRLLSDNRLLALKRKNHD